MKNRTDLSTAEIAVSGSVEIKFKAGNFPLLRSNCLTRMICLSVNLNLPTFYDMKGHKFKHHKTDQDIIYHLSSDGKFQMISYFNSSHSLLTYPNYFIKCPKLPSDNTGNIWHTPEFYLYLPFYTRSRTCC